MCLRLYSTCDAVAIMRALIRVLLAFGRLPRRRSQARRALYSTLQLVKYSRVRMLTISAKTQRRLLPSSHCCSFPTAACRSSHQFPTPRSDGGWGGIRRGQG